MTIQRKKYLIKYYYIGVEKYFGSQRQKSELTIERSLLDSLEKKGYIKDEKESEFEAASRTDRLVSARSAAFTFFSNKEPILMEINSELPLEIGVFAYVEVPPDFSSRYNVIYRHYKYLIPLSLISVNGNTIINMEIMIKACKELEGHHDFINFSKADKNKENTIRELVSVTFIIENDFLIFEIKGDAFLRQQIRRMIKKVIDLGMGIIKFDQFLELFDVSKRFSYQPLDPNGLILWDVVYDSRINFKIDLKSVIRMEDYFKEQMETYRSRQKLFELLQDRNFG